MTDTPLTNRVERVAKALPVALAGIYVAGFIIVALRLAGYGASSLDLFRIQYLAAGFWFGTSCSFLFILFEACRSILAQFSYQVIQFSLKRSFLRRTEARTVAGTVVGDGFIVVGVAVFTFSFERMHRTAAELFPKPSNIFEFALAVAMFDVLLRFWLLCKARENDRTAWPSESYLVLFLLPMAAFGSMEMFALDIYPTVPYSMGGGKARQVVFWLGPPSASTDAFIDREGRHEYSVPYELLLESESSYVVVSPKDNQRSVEFDRKAVQAMIVLGKRPRSAPANFQRNIEEPANDEYEVVERSQREVPNFMEKGTHAEVDYVLLRSGHKFYAECDTTAIDKLDPTATCAFRVLRSYECAQATDRQPKKVLSDLQCKDDEGHPVYLYVSKKE